MLKSHDGQNFALGFLLVAVAPGALLIPKLAEFARANLPFAVGLMVILAVVTIMTVPLTASIILPLDDSLTFNVRWSSGRLSYTSLFRC